MGYLTGQAKPPSSEVPQVGADRKEVKDSAGKVIMMLNPDFEDWDAADQQVLSYLLGSLSKEILIHVSTCTTVAEAWVAIQGVFASRMHACTVNIRLALGTTRKGNLSTLASNSYNIYPNWYADTSATDHITGELEMLAMRSKYQEGDQIHMKSGAGMDICYIGHNIVHTPHRSIYLNNILYVPRTKKNLGSIHCLTSDNSISMEFHLSLIFIKDRRTRNILLRGRCVGGLQLYPPRLQCCGASINTRHNCLDHASDRIVKQVARNNNILCSSEPMKHSVCDAYQQAKSHQLSYSSSTSVSKFPL
jgi:hypothetical protein